MFSNKASDRQCTGMQANDDSVWLLFPVITGAIGWKMQRELQVFYWRPITLVNRIIATSSMSRVKV